MLEGTDRAPDEIVTIVPPDLIECTVEKVAVNAVMAGCRPEYLPVVLAAVEGACTDEFNMHGLLATTYFSGPVVMVNGPITGAIGMNSGINALGQGNRANATIGRALQLTIRNVGGGRPGGVDRATLGNPGKYTFCFAEDEAGSPWEPLSVERGFSPGQSTVTLFAGEGPRGVVDQLSRDPESLSRSLATGLRSVAHPKLALGFDAVLVVSPEHARVFREAGWTKARLRQELGEILTLDGDELARGVGGITEGMPDSVRGSTLPKFRDGGLLIIHAGGRRRPVQLGDRWVDVGPGRQPAGHLADHLSAYHRPIDRGALTMPETPPTTVLDPTSERHPVARQQVPRPASLDGLTIGLLDISKPRGDVFLDRFEERLVARRPASGAVPQADLHQTGTDRPPPRDLDPLRRGHRGARRLRQLHVVQCARHRRSRGSWPPGRLPGVHGVHRRGPGAGRGHRLPTGARVRPPPDPGPHRRRDAPARRRRRRRGPRRADSQFVSTADLRQMAKPLAGELASRSPGPACGAERSSTTDLRQMAKPLAGELASREPIRSAG